MGNVIIQPRYLKRSTAQVYMNCSSACLDRLIKDSYLTLKFIPTDSKPRIDREEIDKLMDGMDIEELSRLSADDMVDAFVSGNES